MIPTSSAIRTISGRLRNRSRPKQPFAGLAAAQYVPVISTQVLQEFYNTITRKFGMSPTKARKELEVLARTETVQVTASLVLGAAALNDSDSVQFWDALVVVPAIKAGCDELWSEDLQEGLLAA